MERERIPIVVVDADDVTRSGLEMLFTVDERFDLVRSAARPSEVGRGADPLVVVMDPVVAGSAEPPWLTDARERFPQAHIIVHTSSFDAASLQNVVLNNSLADFDSTAESHIAFHETAHALGINDTTTACWSSDWLVYPLMHKSYPESNCNDGEGGSWRYFAAGSYSLLNYWATPNEKQAVKDRNGW